MIKNVPAFKGRFPKKALLRHIFLIFKYFRKLNSINYMKSLVFRIFPQDCENITGNQKLSISNDFNLGILLP